jgi:hypothetical protein
MKIGELLLEAGLVEQEQIEAALRNREGLRLGSALIAARAVEPDVIARTLAQQIGVPPAKSADLVAPSAAARALVPEALCKRLWALPYAVHGSGTMRVLEVAMRDPEDQGAINELKIAAGMRIDARVAPELLLREALNPRAEIPTPAAFAPPAAAAAPGAGSGELELLELDDRPRAGGGGRRGAALGRVSVAPPSTSAPTTGSSPAVPLPPAAATVLPPLQYDADTSGRTLGKVLKWLLIAAFVGSAAWVVLRFKQCMTPTTKKVPAHYDSKFLGLGIDFPEDAGWRVSFKTAKVGDHKAELFYRGGVPEMPVVAMILARGPAEDPASAARRFFDDPTGELRVASCEHAPERAGAVVCRGGGKLQFGTTRYRSAEVDVFVWSVPSGDVITAIWINPDRTLSETQYVISSIVEN